MAALKGEKIQVADVIYWLNNIMIKLLRGFASYRESEIQSLRIPVNVDLIPKFIFFFRKSPFI